jgi:transporter family protein
MWILFAVLAAFFWAINNMIDKFILTKWVKQPFVLLIVLALIGLISGAVVYVAHGIDHLSTFGIVLALVAGIFSIVMTATYFKAVQIEEVSRVAPLFYISPLFILLFATIFLGEIFTPAKYLGIFLVLAGAVMISTKDIAKLRFGKAVWWMLLSAFALAINQLIAKYLLGLTDFWTVFFYIRVGAFIGIIPFAWMYLPELVRNVREHGGRVLGLISLNEFINIAGVLLFTLSISIGSVTLANTLASVQQIFVLLFAVILSIFYPSILKEEIGRSTVFSKLIAIICMFIGVALIT